MILGKLVSIEFLDHEYAPNTEFANLNEHDLKSSFVYGKIVKDYKKYYVLSTWHGTETGDIYRILKDTILKVKVIK